MFQANLFLKHGISLVNGMADFIRMGSLEPWWLLIERELQM